MRIPALLFLLSCLTGCISFSRRPREIKDFNHSLAVHFKLTAEEFRDRERLVQSEEELVRRLIFSTSTRFTWEETDALRREKDWTELLLENDIEETQFQSLVEKLLAPWFQRE